MTHIDIPTVRMEKQFSLNDFLAKACEKSVYDSEKIPAVRNILQRDLRSAMMVRKANLS